MINLEHANTLKEIADQMHQANAELTQANAELTVLQAAIERLTAANERLWQTAASACHEKRAITEKLEAAQKTLDQRDSALLAYEGCKTAEHRQAQADARAEAWKAVSDESEKKAKAFEQDNNRLRAEIQAIISAVKTAIYGQGKSV